MITTPISADSKRGFITMKRIKIFLLNANLAENLNNFACLSIHKEYIKEIPNFNNKVLSNFNQMKNC